MDARLPTPSRHALIVHPASARPRLAARPALRRVLQVGLSLGLWLGSPFGAQASSLRYCEHQVELTPRQQDHLLRFAAAVKGELEASGQRVALASRSGQDLHRIGQRYSHAGVSLLASPNTPWSVRQLYYACEEQRPRIFDQGLAGFVMGTANPELGYISLVLLPTDPAKARALEQAALDKPQALNILATRYSANAYAFSDIYQNCNQWVAELLATAWHPLAAPAPASPSPSPSPLTDTPAGADAADGTPHSPEGPEPQAWGRMSSQAWLQAQGYQPTSVELGWAALIWAANIVPFVHNNDHPDVDLAARRYRVSLPASIESFIHAQAPEAQRIELCHNLHHIVIHRGWSPLAEGCQPGDGDVVQRLDDPAPPGPDAVVAP
jgi:hypothetical protein